jgi:hypothetical protein
MINFRSDFYEWKSTPNHWLPIKGNVGTPNGAVCDIHPHQMKSMPSSTIFVINTPILKVQSSLGVALCFPWDITTTMHFQI